MVEGFGWCDLHNSLVDEGQYEWKGCWGCRHFSSGHDFPYASTEEAASELVVSPSTIRRWVKSGKLEGWVLEQVRFTGSLPSPRKYHITRESIGELQRTNRQVGRLP